MKNSLFSSVPGVGNVAPAATGTASTSSTGASTLGANLPHVDPNHFQGTVHWGPEQVISGSQVGQVPPSGGAAGSGTGSN